MPKRSLSAPYTGGFVVYFTDYSLPGVFMLLAEVKSLINSLDRTPVFRIFSFIKPPATAHLLGFQEWSAAGVTPGDLRVTGGWYAGVPATIHTSSSTYL